MEAFSCYNQQSLAVWEVKSKKDAAIVSFGANTWTKSTLQNLLNETASEEDVELLGEISIGGNVNQLGNYRPQMGITNIRIWIGAHSILRAFIRGRFLNG